MWDVFKKQQLIDIYRTMVTSRLLDEKMLKLIRQGKSFFHIGAAGHEATQVGACLAMKPGYDWAYPYYRDQAFVLQWGLSPYDVVQSFLAKKDDPSSGGRQMPQHYGHKSLNIVSQSSPTGTQYLQATGTALGCKKAGTDELVYVSSGEGTTSQGDFYEAINWATREKLPVIFFIQDNKYAISVHKNQQLNGSSVYDMAMGYKNLHRHEINGLCVEEAFKTVSHCVDLARSGNGPSLILAHTVRLMSHSSSDDQAKYRDKDELEHELSLDPVKKFANRLILEKLVSIDDIENIRTDIKDQIDQIADEVELSPMPDAEDVEKHLFSGYEFSTTNLKAESSNKPCVMVDAINHALKEEMQNDESVLLYGQDVADNKGGVFTVTKGLSTMFGEERVFNAPLAESSIVGVAVGLGVRGYNPVVEIQFGDYIWTSMMQIRNELATMRWRSNGAWPAPVVIRTTVGGYIHGGLCHSQNIEGFFTHLPGMYICYPSNAADAKGLLKQAIRLNDPVLFLEHKALYRQSYAMRPEPDENYILPFGKAFINRQGKDLTIVTYGAMVQKSIEVADKFAKEDIGIEVIDLRTLYPLDIETIGDSVKKTNRVLIVHEDTLTGGFGGEIASLIGEKYFQHLDAPVKRVAAMDLPVPYNWELEKVVLPQNKNIEKVARELISF
jgi:2-oxoisovalerate dehydrogenase E1 component